VDFIDWALLPPVEGAARSGKQIRYAQANDDRDQNRDELKLADLTWHGEIIRRMQQRTEVGNLNRSASPPELLDVSGFDFLGARIDIDA
jgi:hypothetical protein